MRSKCNDEIQENYETTDLKLSALIISAIPRSSFEITQEPNCTMKTIRLVYLKKHQSDVSKLINDFINKRACADVYLFNKAISDIRDKIKGKK